MLLGVSLTNFKKHKDLSVEFTDGMNVIRGPNFAGKSTVLSAIAFGLYGIKAIGSDKNELITTGEKSCKVVIGMVTPEGKEVEVIRTNRDAKVTHKGKDIATGNAAATAWVEETFGADVKEFLTHTYSRQMETSVLLTAGASDLQKKVERMAKVSIVDKIITLAGKEITYLSGKVDGIEIGEQTSEELSDQLKEMQEDEAQFLVELNANKEKKSTLHGDLIKLIADIRQHESNNQIINDAILDLDTVNQKLVANGEEIDEYELKLSNFPDDLEKQAKFASDKEAEFLSDYMKNMELVPKRDSLVKSLDAAENWIKESGLPNFDLAKVLDPKIESQTEVSDEHERRHAECEAILRDHQQTKNKLAESIEQGVCPTCERPHENVDVEALKRKLNFINIDEEKLWENVNEALESYRNENSILQQLLEEHPGEGTKESLNDAYDKVKKIKVSLGSYSAVPSKEELTKASGSLDLLRTIKADVEQAVTNRSIVLSSLKILKQAGDDLVDEAASLQPTADKDKFDINPLLEEKELVNSQFMEAEVNLTSETSAYNQCKFEVSRASEELQRVTNREELLKDTQKRLKITGDLQKYLRTSRSRFLGSIWGVILARASEIASSTTQGQEDQITEIRMRDNGTFSYVEKGVEFSVRSSSGCQQEIMGVALRLALCDLFYGQSSYLMLDEASSQMNEENSAALAGILAATGKQILYVTHRMAEQTIAQNVIFIGGEQ